jgi:hypothetical protein
MGGAAPVGGVVIRAAVDIGANTVRLLVLDEEGNDLERRFVVAGLGHGVDATLVPGRRGGRHPRDPG